MSLTWDLLDRTKSVYVARTPRGTYTVAKGLDKRWHLTYPGETEAATIGATKREVMRWAELHHSGH